MSTNPAIRRADAGHPAPAQLPFTPLRQVAGSEPFSERCAVLWEWYSTNHDALLTRYGLKDLGQCLYWLLMAEANGARYKMPVAADPNAETLDDVLDRLTNPDYVASYTTPPELFGKGG